MAAILDPSASRGLVVQAAGLNHHFGEGEARNQVLFDNTIDIEPGQLVIMTGPSGSGKSTLLTLIGALRKVQEGHLTVMGRTLHGISAKRLVEVRRQVGFIFQMHNLFDALSAYENVRMSMELADTPPGDMRERGCGILERLGLGARLDYKPRALSGGQRQRVAVARALVNRPKLVLADEPTAALDKVATGAVVELLRELADREGSAILMVTHDNRILNSADRIINMVDGRIVSDVIVREAVVVCEFLRTVDLFSRLTGADLTCVAERMRRRRFAPGDKLIVQGEQGHEFFLIRSGRVSVRIDKGGKETVAAHLDAGDCFGEQALITGEGRNATIIAEEEGIVYVLDKEGFDTAVNSSPDFHQQLLNIYFQRQ